MTKTTKVLSVVFKSTFWVLLLLFFTSMSCHKRSKCPTYQDSDFFTEKSFKEKMKEEDKAVKKAATNKSYSTVPGLTKRNKRKKRSSIWGTR